MPRFATQMHLLMIMAALDSSCASLLPTSLQGNSAEQLGRCGLLPSGWLIFFLLQKHSFRVRKALRHFATTRRTGGGIRFKRSLEHTLGIGIAARKRNVRLAILH